MNSFNLYLKQFPNYKPSVFESARPHLSEQTLKSGEYFLQQGKISRKIAFIEKGLVRLYYLHDGKEITQCFCKEHTVTTAYKSLITQQASDISIQAIEDTQLITISYEALQKLFSVELFWQQVGRLAAENEFIVSESHNRFLKDLSATERYLHILEHEQALINRVPLNYLASYLQITPETLSRIRKKISRT